MLNELIPHTSRHFLYSILENNHNSRMTIIETITESRPDEVGEFLSSLTNCLVTYFFQFEVSLKNYDKIRIQALELKNSECEDNVEELN